MTGDATGLFGHKPDLVTPETDDTVPGEPVSVRIAAAVKLTGIGRSTLYELINSGQIESFKIGRSRFIPYRALKRLIGT